MKLSVDLQVYSRSWVFVAGRRRWNTGEPSIRPEVGPTTWQMNFPNSADDGTQLAKLRMMEMVEIDRARGRRVDRSDEFSRAYRP